MLIVRFNKIACFSNTCAELFGQAIVGNTIDNTEIDGLSLTAHERGDRIFVNAEYIHGCFGMNIDAVIESLNQ